MLDKRNSNICFIEILCVWVELKEYKNIKEKKKKELLHGKWSKIFIFLLHLGISIRIYEAYSIWEYVSFPTIHMHLISL